MAVSAVTCAAPGSTRSRTRTGILPGLSTRHFSPSSPRSGIGIAALIGRRVPSLLLLVGNVSVRARMRASLGALGRAGGGGGGSGRVCGRRAGRCWARSRWRRSRTDISGWVTKLCTCRSAAEGLPVRACACVCVRSLFSVPPPPLPCAVLERPRHECDERLSSDEQTGHSSGDAGAPAEVPPRASRSRRVTPTHGHAHL